MHEQLINDDLVKYIELHENFLTAEECQAIIEKYKFEPTVEKYHFPSETGDLRTFMKTDISEDSEAVFGSNGLTVEGIVEKTRALSEDYLKRHNLNYKLDMSTIRFLQHKDGTPMVRHYDEEMDYIDNKETFRLCAPLVYLNDNYEEGEIVFGDMGYTYKPKAGTLLIFPASFMYAHHVNAPKGSNKYILKFNFNVNKDEYLTSK